MFTNIQFFGWQIFNAQTFFLSKFNSENWQCLLHILNMIFTSCWIQCIVKVPFEVTVDCWQSEARKFRLWILDWVTQWIEISIMEILRTSLMDNLKGRFLWSAKSALVKLQIAAEILPLNSNGFYSETLTRKLMERIPKKLKTKPSRILNFIWPGLPSVWLSNFDIEWKPKRIFGFVKFMCYNLWSTWQAEQKQCDVLLCEIKLSWLYKRTTLPPRCPQAFRKFRKVARLATFARVDGPLAEFELLFSVTICTDICRLTIVIGYADSYQTCKSTCKVILARALWMCEVVALS